MKQSLRFTRNLISLLVAITLSLSLAIQAQSTRTLNSKKYVQSNGKWYQQEGSKQYEVNTSVITVKWKSSTTTSQKTAAISSQGAAVLRSNILGFVDLRVAIPGDVMQIVENISKSGLVESSELNTFGEYVATPNDPYYSSQWYLNQANDHDIDMPEAWDLSTGSSSVIVGILDSGTDWAHTDLDGNIWTNSGEDAWSNPTYPDSGNHVDDDGNGLIDDWKGWDFFNNNNDSRGPFWHGTHVAGIVSAETNNGTGIAGIAGGWGGTSGAKMLVLGVGDYGPDGSILDDAILYAASKGVKVITMSLSVGQTTAIDNALATAYNTYGCFIDCAAGNDGDSVRYPATNQYVAAVSATDQNDNYTSWTNRGSQISVSAPGVDIYSTQLNNTYGYSSGTSFSAPIVAGIASLLYSVNSGLTNAQVKSIIELTAEDKGTTGRDNYYGYGRVNAYKAVQPPSAPQNLSYTNVSGHPRLSWSAAEWDVKLYEIWRDLGSGYTKIAEVNAPTTTYDDYDLFISESNPYSAWYYVKAKDLTNLTSTASSSLRVSYYGVQKEGLEIVQIPSDPTLYQNYPNPFNPSTTIKYSVPEEQFVSIKLFNGLGQEITTIVEGVKQTGFYQMSFDASHLPSGIYFYTMTAGNTVKTQKMILQK